MEQIKLLIWDLDETFWNGTLSDESVQEIPEFVNIVKTLTDRGIINSICSKNDFEKTKKAFSSISNGELWDLFVFPSINWEPKGQRVKTIIEQMQLRNVNVLFVDDNLNNLKEVEYVCPGIQTTMPNKLIEIFNSPAMAGKDDRSHERLSQYKILEQKTEARKAVNSNEEFLYQSDIRVEMIENVVDKIDRIHEMIHRNNQLNFTKDRISIEQVKALFLDETVRCGIVHVYDKFGDHGIVGCYAIKNDKALQFVFSCRILGMGVEQYVYEQLGYPQIQIVGEVAGELNVGQHIGWINQKREQVCAVEENTIVQTKNYIKNNVAKPTVIAYGSCAIRPLCSYISPKAPELINFKFDEIDYSPTILNIAITKKFGHKINEWLSKVNTFSALQTFDLDLYSADTNFIIVTTIYERGIRKYTSKNDGSYFYSTKLTDKLASQDILTDYTETIATYDDLYNELSYICQNVSQQTKLMVMTAPEVIFPQKGKDIDYEFRIESNRVLEKLCRENNNFILLDTRKYAKSPADFFDPWVAHMNRQIGNNLANDFFKLAGITKELLEPSKTQPTIPSNAVKIKTWDSGYLPEKLDFVTYIRNGEFYVSINLENRHKYECRFEICRNHWVEDKTDWGNDFSHKTFVTKTGFWFVKVYLREKGKQELLYTFHTQYINYSELNYVEYLEPNAENWNDFKLSLHQFWQANQNNLNRRISIQSQIAWLYSQNINIADYFLMHRIEEISIYTDTNIGNILIPLISNSKLKIKNIYTNEWHNSLLIDEGLTIISTKWFDKFSVEKNDVVLVASDISYAGDFIGLINKSPAQTVYLSTVLSSLLTNNISKKLSNLPNSPQIISVRIANCCPYNAFPYDFITPNERAAYSILKNENKAYSQLDNYKNFPPQFKNIPLEELKDTLKKPIFQEISSFNYTLKDIIGKYVNIENGQRRTINQAFQAQNTIYVYGTSIAYGLGVKDDETICSHLQKIIGDKYKVENCANAWDHNYSAILRRIFNTAYKPNDIVIILLQNWQSPLGDLRWHWLNWDELQNPIKKLDAFPIFQKPGRPDYFLLPNAINSQGNLEIAKLIAQNLC